MRSFVTVSFYIILCLEDITKDITEDHCLTIQMQETASKTFCFPVYFSAHCANSLSYTF